MQQHCTNELPGIFTSMPLCRTSFSFMVHCVGRRQQHPGRQPRLMKAPEPTEHDFNPLLCPHIHKQIQIYQCIMLHLLVSGDFLINPFNFLFISSHFLSAGGTWTQTGAPCLGRFTCADSKAAEQDFPDFTEHISRLPHMGLPSIHLIPLFTYKPSLNSL